MKLSDFIDLITRDKSQQQEIEHDFLFSLLDSVNDLYYCRRATRSEQVFWNQFWYDWDFPKLRDARQQALKDMSADKYFRPIKENSFFYRNFEKAVVADQNQFRYYILWLHEDDYPDFASEIFYKLQSQVQQFLECYDLPPIITKRLNDEPKGKKVKSTGDKLARKQEIAKAKKESLDERRARLQKERKSKKAKKSSAAKIKSEKKSKWPGYCRLQIQTPKGDFIELGNSNLTFLEFVMRVGYKKVRNLGLTFEDESIFSDTPKNGWWKEVTKGVYLCCKMNCELKIEFINNICKAFNLSYTPSMTEPLGNSI